MDGFLERLTALIDGDLNLHRPFVCDGLPEKCTVLVIGENPGTKTNQPWGRFWDNRSGFFDLPRFEADYREKRISEGKKPFSQTRLALNRLRSSGLNCLETNVYKNERLGGHGAGAPNVSLIEFFIDCLPELKGVIVHGKVAQACIGNLSLPKNVRFYAEVHFRSLPHLRIDKIARELREKSRSSA